LNCNSERISRKKLDGAQRKSRLAGLQGSSIQIKEKIKNLFKAKERQPFVNLSGAAAFHKIVTRFYFAIYSILVEKIINI